LEAVISSEGMSSVSKSGVVHLNPAVGEARQTRSALARVISGVQLREDVKDPVKQRAAQAKWRAHNDAKRRA
jgi:DnaJ-domain-containing protein 1